MALGTYPGPGISMVADREAALLYFYWSGAAGSAASLIEARWKQRAEELLLESFAGPARPYAAKWLHNDLMLFFCADKQEEPGRFRRELMLSARAYKERLLEPALREELRGAPLPSLHAGCAFGEFKRGEGTGRKLHEMAREAMQNGQHEDALDDALRLGELERLLENQALRSVYQPIVDIRERRPLGYEALSRPMDTDVFNGPLPLFEFAERAGKDYALDRLARERAISGSAGLAKEQKLFLNLSPRIIDAPQFAPWKTLALLESHGLTPAQVVFEITERSSIRDFGSVQRVLAHYRSQGYKIAIDDVGAGYSSLLSIVELRPDYIKVDRSIVSGLHADTFKEHMLGTLVEAADRMGIALIAEGVETQQELDKLISMGVHYAQGYLLGRPGPMA
ncbi:EAL domain-containing protein [Cohnella hashimotonis]|uniref:EAL domain-containing protein n=1 Tax=Cohnella hashimotonis TaxID=2826895 RepID=A0ABT6TMG7_9BACL|nr:EAL domain-containing protein [Cohnella hashimotonis]MDI4647515.1 EAL domain-containing protein [Cohnella hashimotonis]